MAGLSADLRNHYFLIEATRAGIHQPLLAALYAVHHRPALQDGEAGMGISPANRIGLNQVSTFPDQVQFAASTLRSITDKLTAQGWKGADIWEGDEGRYSDRFIQAIANGYTPPASDLSAARLESAEPTALLQAYWADLARDEVPLKQAFLDPALVQLVEQIPRYYMSLSHQRHAFLETVRIWRKLNTQKAAIASLLRTPEASLPEITPDITTLDRLLVQFIQQLSPFYAGYPHQREALIRLTQLWRQLESRAAAIASLQISPSPETDIGLLDPALIAFVQRLPRQYQGKGEQRSAMTEAFRLWQDLDSRGAALKELGVEAKVLTASNPDRTALINAATQLDRALLDFIKRVPVLYQSDRQREALIRLVQLWRNLEGRDRTIQSLLDDVIRMEQGSRSTLPIPEPVALPPRPDRWTPDTIQIHAALLPNSPFTWAEATHGGSNLPTTQATVDAIVRMAELAQQVSDRLGYPLRITKWYIPDAGESKPRARTQHAVGGAIEFYCDGLTSSQLYQALDPWWLGGLARCKSAPLCYIDSRDYCARWQQEKF